MRSIWGKSTASAPGTSGGSAGQRGTRQFLVARALGPEIAAEEHDPLHLPREWIAAVGPVAQGGDRGLVDTPRDGEVRPWLEPLTVAERADRLVEIERQRRESPRALAVAFDDAQPGDPAAPIDGAAARL